LSFDTPGSRVDRELTTEFQLDRQRQQVRLDIKTPWKKANIRGSLVNEAALKKALLSATLDETTEYSASAEVQVARDLYLNTLNCCLPFTAISQQLFVAYVCALHHKKALGCSVYGCNLLQNENLYF